jgi:hypothetical protein
VGLPGSGALRAPPRLKRTQFRTPMDVSASSVRLKADGTLSGITSIY